MALAIMNPYQTPKVSEEINFDASNIDEHPRYDKALNMVLRGEERDEVYKRFEVNKVDILVADLIYQDALKERVGIIRSHFKKLILVGVICTVIPVLIVCFFWFILGFIMRLVFLLCFACLCYGMWKLVSGILGYKFASSTRGEISHIIS